MCDGWPAVKYEEVHHALFDRIVTSSQSINIEGQGKHPSEIRNSCHKQFFHHNSNVMEISFCSHPNTNEVIATIFGTWHDSWAVMACAKFCCDMITSNWIRAKCNFHRIWIVMEKSLVKWVPGTHVSNALCAHDWNIVQIIYAFMSMLMIKSDHIFGTCRDMCQIVNWSDWYR